MNKKRVIWVAVTLVLIAGIVAAFFLTRPMLHYRNGTNALMRNNYTKAFEEFRAAGDYQDAEEKAEYAGQAISFSDGEKALEVGDYKTAITEFTKAKGFPDAEKKLKEAAELAFENEDWQSVLDVYQELPESNDSRKWYASGQIEEENGNYQNAIKKI